MLSRLIICTFSLASTLPAYALQQPASFKEAKSIAAPIYKSLKADTLYCGCPITWAKGSSGRPNLTECGYAIRKDVNRATRIEWEHIVPASHLAQGKQCWRQGGRTNCERSDKAYNIMAGDLHNLYPTVGEVNKDRNNYQMGMIPSGGQSYGQCTSKVDFTAKVFQPREEARGLVARTHFYMYDRYNLSMSRQQQQLFMAWDKQYPVTKAELERDGRIARITGHHNEFVTGAKTWTMGYKPHTQTSQTKISTFTLSSIKGNSRSRIYHLSDCPNYNDVSEKNVVIFPTASEAEAAGYRKASNCP